MHPHVVRAALIGAGFPAWPAALEWIEAHGGGRRDTPRGALDLDVVARLADGPTVPDGTCPVGRLGDAWLAVDADGVLYIGGAPGELP